MSQYAEYVPLSNTVILPQFDDIVSQVNQDLKSKEDAELDQLENMLRLEMMSGSDPDVDPLKNRINTFLLNGVVTSLAQSNTNTTQTPLPTLQTTQTETTNTKKEDVSSKSTNMTITAEEKAKYEKMSLEDLLKEDSDLGASIRITSGYRGSNNKVGHAGSRSWHAHKDSFGNSKAYDIVPKGMKWPEFKQKLKSSTSFQKWLVAHNFNVNDETIPSVMRRTGATGPHFHLAPEHFSLLDLTKVKQGGILDTRVNKLKNLRYGRSF